MISSKQSYWSPKSVTNGQHIGVTYLKLGLTGHAASVDAGSLDVTNGPSRVVVNRKTYSHEGQVLLDAAKVIRRLDRDSLMKKVNFTLLGV